MKLKIVLPVLLTLLSLLHPLHGVETTTLDDLWYYEIGGAQPVSAPPNPKITTLTLPGSADLNLGFSCGRFDPEFSVTEAIDRFAADADLMIQHMVQSAFQLLFSLPALILQRANPELYNLFQTYLADAQARLAIATKTCEQLESDIGQGKNPFEEWIRLAKTQKWRSKM
ncbi:MAG: integrating conjugative element protein, partial [bacterium]|nr:integrating conjugative element protein [bacterium]